MFNFEVNWNNFIWQNIWPTKRKAVRYAWLKLLFTPIKHIHSKFILFKDEQTYLAVHTGQKIYLEKLLNDQFDNDDRGIYIGLISGLDKLFIKQKSELLPIYIYDKWDASKAYVIGNYAVYGTSVWRCIANNTGSVPFIGSTRWVYHKDRLYLAQKSEYNTKGFIVYVPTALSFDETQMRAFIDLYKLAGMYYEIITY
jgi:hypothetical protein